MEREFIVKPLDFNILLLSTVTIQDCMDSEEKDSILLDRYHIFFACSPQCTTQLAVRYGVIHTAPTHHFPQ
jgi:hypothetical protein